jgi:hypothetical protein
MAKQTAASKRCNGEIFIVREKILPYKIKWLRNNQTKLLDCQYVFLKFFDQANERQGVVAE